MEQDTLNILVPALVGGLATVITAYFSFRVNNKKTSQEAQASAHDAAEKANQAAWNRITELMEDQKTLMEEQRVEIATLRQRLDDDEKERGDLMDELQKTKSDLDKMSRELAESYTEINELRDVLTIVRNENNQQKVDMEQLRGRIRDLEAENARLKGVSANRRDRL